MVQLMGASLEEDSMLINCYPNDIYLIHIYMKIQFIYKLFSCFLEFVQGARGMKEKRILQ